jgi:hypothetical protein
MCRSPNTPAISGIIVAKVVLDQDASQESRIAGDGAVLRINCGGPTVTDAAGQTWISDLPITPGGDTVQPSDYIAVNYVMSEETTDAGRVFETERYGATLSYNLEVVHSFPAHPTPCIYLFVRPRLCCCLFCVCLSAIKHWA